jgi:hypothetical protein
MTSGPVLFARYAYPPNRLGYCGPDDSAALLEYADAGTSDGGLVDLARRFAGAWPYLALIAAANRRADPLDREVVAAYWLGGPLLERVPQALLARQLTDRFGRQAGRDSADLARLALLGGRAHHNFHVFAVYPWIGLLRAGHVAQPMRVLEGCRIRWGTVLSIHNGQAEVSGPELRWTGRALVLDEARPRRVTVATEHGRLAPPISPGDVVSLHWDWVCDVLTTRQAATLRRYTASQLAVANRALRRPVADRVLE